MGDGLWKWGDLGIPTVELEGSILLSCFLDLRVRLENFWSITDLKDAVSWSLDLDKWFSVSSCYAHYAFLHLPFGPPNRCDEALGIIWNLSVPFKIKAF